MNIAEDGQETTAVFIAGQLMGSASKALPAVKPFRIVDIAPDCLSFVIQFEESRLRYRVAVEPDGRGEDDSPSDQETRAW